MAASITRGVRVRFKATYFDENDGQNTWSRKHFGDNYDISYCWGTVRKVENNYARVHWEINKKISLVPVVLIADIENDNLLEANTNEENLALRLTQPSDLDDSDKWRNTRTLVMMVNDKLKDTIRSGAKITVDESMFAWYGRGAYCQQL
ncbi:unnamed protein product [Parnassius apollo]|uniref:(apollo) hypothetical protein n=1 Tax=Parnassius apollo TaxID=110799 RepID=A0A8S3XYW9_PARAO|nr:unnamed protein product [Parnassius apollo]